LEKRIDPEPITIIAATAAVIGSSITAFKFIEEKLKDTPVEARRKLRAVTGKLGAELKRLKSDIEIIEHIFRTSIIPNERVVRLGNGALLHPEDFDRYIKFSDQAFQRFRKINKLTLQATKIVAQLPFIDQKLPTRFADEGLNALDNVLRNRNLTVEKAWDEIRYGIGSVEQLIRNLEEQIGD
jgi:hypothetical protein